MSDVTSTSSLTVSVPPTVTLPSLEMEVTAVPSVPKKLHVVTDPPEGKATSKESLCCSEADRRDARGIDCGARTHALDEDLE
eukprot:8509-Eustigmatos_ZCMA.PRE.1